MYNIYVSYVAFMLFLLSRDQSTASVGAQVTARRHPPFRRIRLHACLVLEGLCQCIPCGSAAFFEAPFEPHDSHCKTVWTFVFSINLSNAKSFNPWMVVDSLVTGRWVERFLLVRFSRCYSRPSREQAPGTFDDFDGPCTSSFWRWQVTDERMCSLNLRARGACSFSLETDPPGHQVPSQVRTPCIFTPLENLWPLPIITKYGQLWPIKWSSFTLPLPNQFIARLSSCMIGS